MYSSPVADSIERVRAVWSAAHDTISGNTSPITSRSHTNSAHGPTSAENGPPALAVPAPGPAPKPTQATNRITCSATIHSSRRETITSGASGRRGVTRYQCPRIIAANTPPVAAASTASWIASGTAPSGPPPHVSAPSAMTARPATNPAIAGTTPRRPRARATPVIRARTTKATSARRRGSSNAGSTGTGTPSAMTGRPVSDR